MFEYTFRNQSDLQVNLPKRLNFDLDFLLETHKLIKDSTRIKSDGKLIIHCREDVDYHQMCKLYLVNVLSFLNKNRVKVFINNNFKKQIREFVHQRAGTEYSRDLSVEFLIRKDNLDYYRFEGKNSIDKPVESIASLLVEKSLSINKTDLKNFLNTTIGEVFSNSINHSNNEEVFLLHTIGWEKDKTYLYVSVIDYGKTIVSNVREFLNKSIDGKECIEWAIKYGNTTRSGSGGYGLPTLIKYIAEVKGDLIIFSGDSFYVMQNGCEEMIRSSGNHFFDGTSVVLKVEIFNTSQIVTCNDGIVKCISLDLL